MGAKQGDLPPNGELKPELKILCNAGVPPSPETSFRFPAELQRDGTSGDELRMFFKPLRTSCFPLRSAIIPY